MIAAFDLKTVTPALLTPFAPRWRLFSALVSHARKENDFRRTAETVPRRTAYAAPLLLPEFQNSCHQWPLLHCAPARFAIGILVSDTSTDCKCEPLLQKQSSAADT